MRNQHTTLCKMSMLERRCADEAARLCSALESPLSLGMSGSDMWDKTVSFVTAKTFVFHNGFTKSSREALRRVHSPAEDVAPLWTTRVDQQ